MSVHVTPAMLEAAALRPLPNSLDRPLYEAVNAFWPQFGIDTPLRTAHALAQAAHETGGFKWFTEIGGANYFRRYDGREDLGNTQAGDGYRYRGRGLIHLTGRHNYAVAGAALGLDLIGHPELAAELEHAAKIFAWYWKRTDCNAKADEDSLVGVTRKINGGVVGLIDRGDRLRAVKRHMGLAA